VRALDAVPNDLFAARPLPQALDASGNKLQFARNLRLIVHDRIDVERHNIAAFDILRIILHAVPPDAAPNVIIISNPLAEIQEYGTSRVGRPHLFVIAHNDSR
jgi:hypothetical protein